MPMRREFDDLVRDGYLWYPLDWHRIANVHTMPLFVFLSDGRGAATFAKDVGIERLVRGLDPAWSPRDPNQDWRKIIALFLDPVDVAQTDPARFRWTTLAAAPGPHVYDTDDAGWVISMTDRVVGGFEKARADNPSATVPTLEVVDLDRIFLVGMGSGASLALELLASALRTDGSNLPMFAGAAVLGGTFGATRLNDPVTFPGPSTVLDAWPPVAQVVSGRLLSIQFAGFAATAEQQAALGLLTDTLATPLQPLPEALAELTRGGFDPFGADIGLVPQVRTHNACLRQWADYLGHAAAPLGIGVWNLSPDRHRPGGPSAPVPGLLVMSWSWNTGLFNSFVLPVTLWVSNDGLPPGVWPSLDIPQSTDNRAVWATPSFEGLLEVVRFLAFP